MFKKRKFKKNDQVFSKNHTSQQNNPVMIVKRNKFFSKKVVCECEGQKYIFNEDDLVLNKDWRLLF